MSSNRPERRLALLSDVIAPASREVTTATFLSTLEEGFHGICMSPYVEGQRPGDILSEEQVRRRLDILQPFTGWIRSFSCLEGNEWVPKVARSMGLQTMVGAWLSDNPETNEQEIEALIQLAKEGYVDIAAVGNEVLYRNDLSLEELLGFIRRVKEALPDIPVGYVDAYYEFSRHPELVEVSDVLLTNCYPFWEGYPIEHAQIYLQQMYQQVVQVSQGKKVIVTETGWPSKGANVEQAAPSEQNAMSYFINTQYWAKKNNIETFYFSSFDESWKVGAEGDRGAYWGLWDKDEKLKYV